MQQHPKAEHIGGLGHDAHMQHLGRYVEAAQSVGREGRGPMADEVHASHHGVLLESGNAMCT